MRVVGVHGQVGWAGGDSSDVERGGSEGGTLAGEGGRCAAEVELVHEGSHCVFCYRALGRHTTGGEREEREDEREREREREREDERERERERESEDASESGRKV